MMLPTLYCHGCDADLPHEPISSSEAACTSCGTIRDVEETQVAVVEGMAFCTTCRETLAVGHVCVPDAPACESQTRLVGRCGICQPCRLLQKAYMAAQTERDDTTLYGSPSDLSISEERA
ncbi:hypothetical protein ACBJ59_36300 [Nonomuraea sp. MTCD27]|uniref:hypothetical protein n=1 Tax=Nonomuraea sp. MTCD27 TaxID=1676747 RepID=UPI0035BEF7F0